MPTRLGPPHSTQRSTHSPSTAKANDWFAPTEPHLHPGPPPLDVFETSQLLRNLRQIPRGSHEAEVNAQLEALWEKVDFTKAEQVKAVFEHQRALPEAAQPKVLSAAETSNTLAWQLADVFSYPGMDGLPGAPETLSALHSLLLDPITDLATLEQQVSLSSFTGGHSERVLDRLIAVVDWTKPTAAREFSGARDRMSVFRNPTREVLDGLPDSGSKEFRAWRTTALMQHTYDAGQLTALSNSVAELVSSSPLSERIGVVVAALDGSIGMLSIDRHTPAWKQHLVSLAVKTFDESITGIQDTATRASIRSYADTLKRKSIAISVRPSLQEAVYGGKGLDADLDLALALYESGAKAKAAESLNAGRTWLANVLTDSATPATFSEQKQRLEKAVTQYKKGVGARVIDPTEAARVRAEVITPGFDRLIDLADLSRDEHAAYLAAAPGQVTVGPSEPKLEFPPARLESMFGFGFASDLRRANAFSGSANEARVTELVRARYAKPLTLEETLTLKFAAHSPVKAELEASTVTADFTLLGVKQMFSVDPVAPTRESTRELGRRLLLVADEWLTQPAATRDASIFAEAIEPTYRRLVAQADLSDDTVAREVLGFRAKFNDPALRFPIEHLDGLFGGPNASATVLGQRLELALGAWRMTPETARDPAFFSEGIARAYTRLCDIADWADDATAAKLTQLPQSLKNDPRSTPIELADRHFESFFAHNRDTRLAAAAQTWQRTPPANRDPRLLRLGLLPAYQKSLAEADWGNPDAVKRALAFPALVDEPGVVFPRAHYASLFPRAQTLHYELRRNLLLATGAWLATPAAKRDPVMFSEGLVPAHEWLADHSTWSEDHEATELAQFPSIINQDPDAPRLALADRHFAKFFSYNREARLSAATNEWLAVGAADRDQRMLQLGLLPAYEALVDDFVMKGSQDTDGALRLLAYPGLLSGAGSTLTQFPRRHLDAFFVKHTLADVTRARRAFGYTDDPEVHAAALKAVEVAMARETSLDARVGFIANWRATLIDGPLTPPKALTNAPVAPKPGAKAANKANAPAAAVIRPEQAWADAVHQRLKFLENVVSDRFAQFRGQTVDELVADAATDTQNSPNSTLFQNSAQRLHKVYGGWHIRGSVEQNATIDRMVSREWEPTARLERISSSYQTTSTFSDERTSALQKAVTEFPGNVLNLVEVLTGRREPGTLFAVPLAAPEQTIADLQRLQTAFARLPVGQQRLLLETSLSTLLSKANQGSAADKAAVRAALRENVLDAMERDPEAKPLVDRMQTIFDALPSNVQGRVLAAVLAAPPTTDAPVLLRRLLEPAGIVAIKSGQQMAEDPNVGDRFRVAIEDLRDNNAKMTRLAAWKRAVEAHRNAGNTNHLSTVITELGPTRGTGSVKQVFGARMATGEEGVLGVRRDGVIEDMQSTMGALDVLEDTKHLTQRIKPMLEREVDFRNEPPAFDAMRATPLGQSPLVSIPRVMHATAETIIRTVADGDVISQILRQRELTVDEKARLYELHKLIVRTALDTQPGWLGRYGKEFGAKKTFVLTDPHGGNVADDGTKFGLFDPGQFETLKTDEANAFVRLIASFSRPEWHRARKSELVEKLVAMSRADASGVILDAHQFAEAQRQEAAQRTILTEAYEESFREPQAGVGRKLQLFLLAASKKGALIPDGYFGLAKMLHSVESQAADLGMPSAVAEVTRELTLDLMGPVGRIYGAFQRSP